MKRLPTTITFVVLAALGLTRCDYQAQYRKIPFAVQQYFTKLSHWQKPKKVQIDWQHRKVYWLNKYGEIHAMHVNGSQRELINRGIGAKLGITYIGDFALNSQENAIYFTDLMDIASGLSAIKKSTLKGKHIQAVITFTDETPYAVSWDENTHQLYYLTKRKEAGDYALQVLGKSVPLAVASHKIISISTLLGKLSATSADAQPVDWSASTF